jgi:hypothetical protein
MRSLLADSPGTVTAVTSESRHIRGTWLIRAVIHVACWVPFITAAADSWRGPWRAVGDNAHLATEAWDTLSGWMPLVGQPNELPGAPHDLGPLQYWLLTIPVHADPARGVLWGAVLLAMLAVSVTLEAAYSVLGETGILVAGAVVIAILEWFPGFASRPEDNPNFGMIFFIPTVAACLAVLSGRRKWWPVLVVTASIAAQAHLMFAAASVGLVLIALVTGLRDEFLDKRRYTWLVTGLLAGAACWIAPLEQQFGSPPGRGNMSLLLRADSEQRHIGIAYALKALGSLAAPSPLWWQQDISQRRDLFQVLGSGSAALGIVILAIALAILVMAAFWLRSRMLTGLAAISLLISLCAVASFSLIPAQHALAAQQHDLVFIMFAAVLLAWLTAACAIVVIALRLISRRKATSTASPRGALVPLLARGAAVLIILAPALFSAQQQAAHYPGAGTNSLDVGAALAVIERSMPKHQVFALSVSAPHQNRFQVSSGLCWAMIANGYRAWGYHPAPRELSGRVLTELIIVTHGRKVSLVTGRTSKYNRGIWGPCNIRE